MSILDILLGKSIDDEILGKLNLTNRMTSTPHWQGKVKFAPTNSQIDIYLFDLENSVSKEHQLFYKELEERYTEIKEDIIHLLHNPPDWMGYLPHKDFNKFKLVGLTFPSVKALKESSFFWDMYFSYDPQKPNFTVGMENWNPDKDECYSGE